MRKRNKTNQLNRTASHRKALMRNLIDQLITYGRIETTLVKAKELKRYADNFLSKMRKNDLSAKRKAISVLRTKEAFKKLFTDDFMEFLNSRVGGYVRVIRTSLRAGDAARLAIIELTGKYEPADNKKKAPKKVKTEDRGSRLEDSKEEKQEESKKEVKTENKGEKAPVVEENKETPKVEEKPEVKEEKTEASKEEKQEEPKQEEPQEGKEEDTKPEEPKE